MSAKQLATDAAVVTPAGYVATKAMEQVSMKTYELEPEEDRKREDAVRPGPPFRLAAEKLSQRVLGIESNEDRASTAGMALHYLGGLSWVPVYMVLRRTRGWNPVAAGLATGASQSLILDEMITPAIGASAPNTAYPLSTHVRGFVSHLVYGLTIAAVVEIGWSLTGQRPTEAHHWPPTRAGSMG